MGKRMKTFGDLLTVIVMAVLFLVILLLVVFSAVSYQKAVDIHDANNNTRAVLSYVITAVKANEAETVGISEKDGMQVLTLSDGETGYEQQIFFKDGKVLESYGKAGAPLDPEEALVIGEAKRFEIGYLTENLLEIKTDIGNSYVHIRQ
jgi:hypothetical protein